MAKEVKDVAHACLVLSKEAHARIVSIDASEALALPGVIDFVDVKDIPSGGTNQPGLRETAGLRDDTRVFADGVVEAVGQPIGCIVASDVLTARRAAMMVKVAYEKLPAILTIEEAIEKKSYLIDESEMLKFGKEPKEMEQLFEKCPIVLEGSAYIGAQEHLYMETQASLIVPQENDEWTIFSGTQRPTDAMYAAAAVLGIPACNVVIKVKRIGGAFGGKGTGDGYARETALVAAAKIRRPVSHVLQRSDDIAATGKRHPALFQYKVGCDEEGRLLAVDVKMFLDGGYSIDHTYSVSIYSKTCDALYLIPNMRVEAYCMKTNKHSNTAFRAYGRPQTFFFAEQILSQVAHRVGRNIEEVKKLNFSKEGDVTLSQARLRMDCLKECWAECEQLSQFNLIEKQCKEFNRVSTRYRRAVAMAGSRHGIMFNGPFEQGTALVQLLMDGTVRLAIGTVEMGQGINTKCTQIAATTLNIPVERIVILEQATDKTANTPESGGSVGTDINGWAVKKACEKLLEGIRPYLEKHNNHWPRALTEAYNDKVPLQASETIKIDRERFHLSPSDHPYFTTGAASVLVELDCLTGEHRLLSVDIVMDVGKSINPAIDIGQIEGAFIQGYGLMTSEEIEIDANGKIANGSVYAYKIPTIDMIPARFRVKLLENGKNGEGQIYGSKGIGEPPLLLAIAAHGALRKAIQSWRHDKNGKEDFLRLDAPLTAKNILRACNI